MRSIRKRLLFARRRAPAHYTTAAHGPHHVVKDGAREGSRAIGYREIAQKKEEDVALAPSTLHAQLRRQASGPGVELHEPDLLVHGAAPPLVAVSFVFS